MRPLDGGLLPGVAEAVFYKPADCLGAARNAPGKPEIVDLLDQPTVHGHADALLPRLGLPPWGRLCLAHKWQ